MSRRRFPSSSLFRGRGLKAMRQVTRVLDQFRASQGEPQNTGYGLSPYGTGPYGG